MILAAAEASQLSPDHVITGEWYSTRASPTLIEFIPSPSSPVAVHPRHIFLMLQLLARNSRRMKKYQMARSSLTVIDKVIAHGLIYRGGPWNSPAPSSALPAASEKRATPDTPSLNSTGLASVAANDSSPVLSRGPRPGYSFDVHFLERKGLGVDFISIAMLNAIVCLAPFRSEAHITSSWYLQDTVTRMGIALKPLENQSPMYQDAVDALDVAAWYMYYHDRYDPVQITVKRRISDVDVQILTVEVKGGRVRS